MSVCPFAWKNSAPTGRSFMKVKKERFKGRLVGLFQHCSRRLIVLLPPNEFLHSSPEALRTIQRGKELLLRNLARKFTKLLGSFTCRKAGTWDRFFHFPSEGRHAEDYSDTRKIQRLRPGWNPRTRVPEASMLATRPPKPLTVLITSENFGSNKTCTEIWLCRWKAMVCDFHKSHT